MKLTGVHGVAGLAVLLVAMQGCSRRPTPPVPAGAQAPPAAAAAQTPPAAAVAPAAGQGRPQMAAIGVPVAGMPFVHDPSTVVRFRGKYYVYATGRGIPFYSSPDGETWTREGQVFDKIPDDVHAVVPKNDGTGVWAPDIVRVGDQFYLYYAVSFWGSFQSAAAVMSNPVLDPKDPAYKWTDRGVVASSDGVEDLNAIDPGVIHAPDGTLWLCYGSYHGTIDLVQLDPKTGQRISPKSPVTILASRSEGTDLIFHDGYYYLFVNHDSCCKGKQSEYNIRVGRARTITGPYADKHGELLTKGAGSLFLAAHDHRIGPGHFGRVLDYDVSGGKDNPESVEAGSEADGAERFSVHYEADMTRGGRSVLDIRPLLWGVDGWPVAGDNLAEGTYQIVSRQSETTLESHVPTAPPPPRPAGAPPPRGPVQDVPGTPIGPAALRLSRYLTLDNQKWTIAPVGGGFYKIVNAGTGDAIGTPAGTDNAAIGLAPYTGADGQLWRLEQFPDGGWRIRNKTGGSLAAAGGGGVSGSGFVKDDWHLWTIATP
jgi:arabinan endo-1,5-alpha-L-arabinosidase